MTDLACRFSQITHTPAFIYDESVIVSTCARLKTLCRDTGNSQFFPIKCHSLYSSLQLIAEHVDGFAVSSLFEAQLAREILSEEKKVHFTSPGLRADEVEILLSLCDGISFNSLSQWQRSKEKALGRVTCGLRVNPQLSFVKDGRYNPCKPHSRLGVPLDQLKEVCATEPTVLEGITGIHFHTNCDASNWSPLLQTVQHLDTHIPDLLRQCQWINLGGGYLLHEDTDFEPLQQAVRFLQDKYGLQVIIEPGAAMVRDACFLVAQVIDILSSDGMQIAVLDTTVNHMPEVFEYQFSPDIVGDTENGDFCYILAGSTCLAGDTFGEYCFDASLEVGSRIIFTGVGAYTFVKAHMFNGINLPAVYALTASGDLDLRKHYSYEDFKNKCGADESIRNTVTFSGQSR